MGWHTVPMVQMRNMGLTWSIGRGDGKKRQKSVEEKYGLGKKGREMTGVLCVKERGEVNSEFDSLVELKMDGLGKAWGKR